jgi:mannosyl-3-phosphoglycerate phosphatase
VTDLIVFTDLDGTLVEEGTYDSGPADAVVRRLQERSAVVVPVTSRSRREVEKLRGALSLSGPFIVENGSAILPGNSGTPTIIGCSAEQATASFRRIQQQVQGLVSLAELPVQEVAMLTGLGEADADLARDREYGVVIVPSQGVVFAQVAELAEALGHRLIEGDRFWHLVGSHADKGRAVRVLLDQLSANRMPRTIALGNGPSDISVLEAVDLPIVIPGPRGPHPALAQRGWHIAPEPGPRGWAAALAGVLLSADEGFHRR